MTLSNKLLAVTDTILDFVIIVVMSIILFVLSDVLGAAFIWLVLRLVSHPHFGIQGYAFLGFFWGVPALLVIFMVSWVLRGWYMDNSRYRS